MADRVEGAGKSAAASAAERRHGPRLDKVFPVWIEGDRGPAVGVARNISEGGMFIETREPQPLGSQVRVTFPAAWGDMSAVAEVRYVCHLLGRLSDGAPAAGTGHAAVRGMGIRFLYFDVGGDRPGLVH